MLTFPEWIMTSAAVVQAVVVIALYGITRRYVALTARLASSAEAQVELLRADRSERHSAGLTQLAALARRLLISLRQLPGPDSEARRHAESLIRSAQLASYEDLETLRRLAASVGPAVGDLARSATQHLSWLLQWAREVQASSIAAGFDYGRLSWREWGSHWTQAEQALISLERG
jgi:hypothetical protein